MPKRRRKLRKASAFGSKITDHFRSKKIKLEDVKEKVEKSDVVAPKCEVAGVEEDAVKSDPDLFGDDDEEEGLGDRGTANTAEIQDDEAENSVKSDDVSSCAETIDSSEEEPLDFLRNFDMNWRFGPCIGISRQERWDRALKNGLSPPERVRQLVRRHDGDQRYTECVWFDYNL